MRLDMGGSLILFVWTEQQYRLEVVRLFQGLNRRLVRMVRAWRLLGLRFVLVRRLQAGAGSPSSNGPAA
jgi:hypothetical protein